MIDVRYFTWGTISSFVGIAVESFDLFVLGAGSGGVRAARIAATHGAKVAICEESRVGGTCVIRGCVPKKLLSYGAHFHDDFEDAASYGWDVAVHGHDWPVLIAAKNREIDRLNGIYLKLLGDAGVRLYDGRGRLVDASTVTVGGQQIRAGKILIATGGRPARPAFPGSELAIISDDVFENLAEFPRRLVIYGGGYIAVEFAGIFRGLGADVTLVYRRDLILRGFDEAIRRQAEIELERRGIRIVHNATVTAVAGRRGALEVQLDNGAGLAANELLLATGRLPYTRDLGLEKAGVETAAGGGAVVVDEYSRTSAPSIYAVGDVTDRVNLTPVAIHEGHAFADTEFGGRPRPVDHRFVPSAVFSQPPIATVGLAQDAALRRYGRLRVYQSEFRPLKYTLTGRQERTLIKLLVEDATDRVIGLHMIGLDAPEIVQGFAVAIKAGLTKTDFDATIGIHPTAAEEIVTLRHFEVIGNAPEN